MDILKKILEAIALIGGNAGAAGVPLTGLIGKLAGILNNLVKAEEFRTGKTREQIFADNGIKFDKVIADLLADKAAGE